MRRAGVIDYFVNLMEELYAISRYDLAESVVVHSAHLLISPNVALVASFNVLASVVHGLRLGSIDRLKKTWATVSPKTLSSWNALNPFIDQSARFDLYRQRCLELSGKPYIPFLGATLQEIHDLEKGTKDSDAKRSNSSGVAQALLDRIAQTSKHFESNVAPVDEIQSYLKEVPVLSDSAAYARSLEVEPRVVAPADEAEENLKDSSDSLTSSPAFFWGVPLVTLGVIAATAVFLYKRQK